MKRDLKSIYIVKEGGFGARVSEGGLKIEFSPKIVKLEGIQKSKERKKKLKNKKTIKKPNDDQNLVVYVLFVTLCCAL